MKLKTLAALTAACAWSLVPPHASAAVCSPAEPAAYSPALSDVTIQGTAADSCGYYTGNDNAWTPGSGWTNLGKSDAENPITGSVNLTPTGTISLSLLLTPPDAVTGAMLLEWVGGPATMDFTFVLKASNEFFTYTFDDLLLSPASGSVSGSYLVSITNFNPNNPDKDSVRQTLSHMSFWARGERSEDPEDPPGPLPEPGALALLGIGGLIAASALRRRRV